MNSRYLTPEHFEGLMSALSFKLVKSRWKEGGKMGYWLFQKTASSTPRDADPAPYEKKEILRTGKRNNFCILL